ncbi:hypothetical protein MNBD_BACTEROID06-1023 [hydrothermal vent metagenome]|uniref:DUF4199 domain-containing protein n=1 Tax=hydrothermal vent metagenome TaxID=652676 RepID=A0A3B0UB30_9ZZZZ
MVRFIIQLILVIAFAYLAQFFMPWWGAMVASALATIIMYGKGFNSFMAGFIGLGGLWFFLAQSADSANQSLLSSKVATLLGLSSSFQLILATAVIGALIGGFSALTGSLFVSMFKKEKKSNSPYFE